LFGFLVVLILVLLTTVQVLIGQSEEARRGQWLESANRATAALEALDPAMGTSGIEAALISIVSQTGVDRIELETASGLVVTAGHVGGQFESIEGRTSLGAVRHSFDTGRIESLRRRFLLTAVICFAAAILGVVLLLVYIRRIARPVEVLIEAMSTVRERPSGIDETEYLLETFRQTISTLRSQEAELKSLHEREKARADDLERITSTLTRSLTSGFMALDPSGRVIEINEAGRTILGFPDLAGESIEAVLSGSPFNQRIAHAVATRESLNREEVHFESDSGPRTIGVTTVHLENESNRYLGMLVLFTDLTQIRKLEERVRETRALADLGEVAAGIAHEFRNSLSTILGYLKLALRSTDPEDYRRKLTAAESEAGELSNAVTVLLNFASPLQLHRVEAGLREIAGSVASRIAEATPAVPVTVHGPDVEICCDPALLGRAIGNVVRNAVSAVLATGRPGSVTLTTSENPPSLTVDDTGVGIDPLEIPLVFLPFHKPITMRHLTTVKATRHPGRRRSES
ncbi:MAG: PAS domain-containing protein, partial [Acidobacteria bacterium]|nr:PAS domain-containing protein [Acidobacteriota bacterium]